MNENVGLFVTEDGFVSEDSGELNSSDVGIRVIPTAEVENSPHEASDEDSGERVEKKVTKIQSPVLKRRRKRQVKKKKVEEEKIPKMDKSQKFRKNGKEEKGKKKSIVDEILSREYWRKKKRREKRKRKEKMKKMEDKKVVVVKSPPPQKPSPSVKDVSPIPDQYDRKEILDGELVGWNAGDSIEILNQKIKEVLEVEKEEVDGEKEVEGSETAEIGEENIGEEGGKESQVVEDQVWDVADGIFRDGEEFFDVEDRTKEILKDIDEESIIKEISNEGENNDEGLNKVGIIINNEELVSVENELNEIFGIKETKDEVGEINPSPKKKKVKRRKRKKKGYKTVLDEILSPGYWNKKKGKKGGKKNGKKKRTKKKKT